jgi:hypothetical protein
MFWKCEEIIILWDAICDELNILVMILGNVDNFEGSELVL